MDTATKFSGVFEFSAIRDHAEFEMRHPKCRSILHQGYNLNDIPDEVDFRWQDEPGRPFPDGLDRKSGVPAPVLEFIGSRRPLSVEVLQRRWTGLVAPEDVAKMFAPSRMAAINRARQHMQAVYATQEPRKPLAVCPFCDRELPRNNS